MCVLWGLWHLCLPESPRAEPWPQALIREQQVALFRALRPGDDPVAAPHRDTQSGGRWTGFEFQLHQWLAEGPWLSRL